MSYTGLKPAMLYKEEIRKGLAEHIYDDEMLYYSGWNGCTLPEIPDSFENGNYNYAIIDNDKVIGWFCYTFDLYRSCLCNIGLYSFDRGNPHIGLIVMKHIKEVIKNVKPHRIAWRAVSENPAIRHYDKWYKSFGGQCRKIELIDATRDKYGKYHNDIIYEVIF